MFRLPKPQKNYTEVPNVVFDLVIPNITNLSALKCYLILIRKTWGWGKIGDWISMSQIVKLTKLARSSAVVGMKWLEDNGYIWSAKAGIPGKEKIMYFLCSEENELMERSVKEGIIKPDKLFELMMKERKE